MILSNSCCCVSCSVKGITPWTGFVCFKHKHSCRVSQVPDVFQCWLWASIPIQTCMWLREADLLEYIETLRKVATYCINSTISQTPSSQLSLFHWNSSAEVFSQSTIHLFCAEMKQLRCCASPFALLDLPAAFDTLKSSFCQYYPGKNQTQIQPCLGNWHDRTTFYYIYYILRNGMFKHPHCICTKGVTAGGLYGYVTDVVASSRELRGQQHGDWINGLQCHRPA